MGVSESACDIFSWFCGSELSIRYLSLPLDKLSEFEYVCSN